MIGEVERRYFVEAAAKVLDILESFNGPEEELSITEIARRAGTTYSSTFRLLYTLERRGYVMRRPGGKRFQLTPARKRFRIGYAALQVQRFQKETTRTIVEACRRLQITLLVKNNDEFNVSKALLNADQLLAEKIDLLVEYQFNDTAGHLIAGKCCEAGVPVIGINFGLPGSYYYGGNNYQTGVLAGDFLTEYARKHWGGRADACVILPAAGLGSTQEARKTGLLDSLRKNMPKLRANNIVFSDPGLSIRDGRRIMKKMLQQLGGKTKYILVASLTDSLGIGAAKAVEEVGKPQRVAIVGQGGAMDARTMIAKGGCFRASVAFFPETYGERVLGLALHILDGEKVPLTTFTNHVVLTAENISDYYPDKAD